ncbi:MAG: hypothetical protein H7829_00195 [Magnetococcus sp. THC-1_WYH]
MSWILIPIPSAFADLTWKSDVTFTKTTFEEDIRIVLREILQLNQTEVFFRPGVGGVASFVFTNSPLKVAFSKLMEEYNLTFSYSDSTNTVTISPATDLDLLGDVFIPQFGTVDEIKSSLAQFKLLDQSVTITSDPATGAMFLEGDRAKVDKQKKLMDRIDRVIKDGKEKKLAELQREREELRYSEERQDFHKEIRIIPLRNATVGNTKTTFQGQNIEVPGIIDSLKAFVGSEEITVVDGKSRRREESNSQEDPLSQSQRSSKPIISIDRRTNSVIVQGTLAQIELIQSVVMSLDQSVPLVQIEVMIVDGEASVTEQLGVRWGHGQNFGQNSNQLVPPNNLVSAVELTKAPGVTNDPLKVGNYQVQSDASGLGATFLYKGSRALLDATLQAMANENKLQTIASPRVVTLNNLQAKITNSNSINFVVTTGDGTKADIKTVRTGVSLDITPSVIPKGDGKTSEPKPMVRLDINVENSSIGTVSTSAVQTAAQEVQTSVIIPDESTFVMGGLFNTSRVEAEDGVPFLRSIPLLGAMFRTNTSSQGKRETVFLITPKVFIPESITNDRKGMQLQEYAQGRLQELERSQEDIRHHSPLLDLTADPSEDE